MLVEKCGNCGIKIANLPPNLEIAEFKIANLTVYFENTELKIASFRKHVSGKLRK